MPTRANRAGQTGRGARARAAILRAAVPLFARHGYRGAPLAAVATAADMTSPGLLHHFPSKAHLLMAVLEDRDRESKRRSGGTFFDGGTATLKAMEDLVAYNASTRDLVQMFTVLVGEGVSEEHPAHEYFVDRYARVRHQITRALEQGQEAGEFRADVDASVVASLVMAVMDGLQVQWLLDEDVDMSSRFGVFMNLIREYLAAPSS
jgi:AcrR family transcriptional regulator